MLPKKKGILIQFWLQDGSGKPFLSTRRPWIRPRPPTRARGRGSNCGTGRSCCPIQPGSAAICFLFSFFSARETENRCMYGKKNATSSQRSRACEDTRTLSFHGARFCLPMRWTWHVSCWRMYTERKLKRAEGMFWSWSLHQRSCLDPRARVI